MGFSALAGICFSARCVCYVDPVLCIAGITKLGSFQSSWLTKENIYLIFKYLLLRKMVTIVFQWYKYLIICAVVCYLKGKNC